MIAAFVLVGVLLLAAAIELGCIAAGWVER